MKIITLLTIFLSLVFFNFVHANEKNIDITGNLDIQSVQESDNKIAPQAVNKSPNNPTVNNINPTIKSPNIPSINNTNDNNSLNKTIKPKNNIVNNQLNKRVIKQPSMQKSLDSKKIDQKLKKIINTVNNISYKVNNNDTKKVTKNNSQYQTIFIITILLILLAVSITILLKLSKLNKLLLMASK